MVIFSGAYSTGRKIDILAAHVVGGTGKGVGAVKKTRHNFSVIVPATNLVLA